MKRMIVFLAFSGLVFVVGLAAGRQVTKVTSTKQAMQSADCCTQNATECPPLQSTADQLTQAHSENTGDPTTISQRTTDLTSADSPEASFIMSASLASHVPEIDGALHLSTDTGNSSISQDVTSSGASRDDLIALIHRMMPNADDETIAVWAESYAGMELADVEFILEQKRRLDPTSRTNLIASTIPTSNDIPNATTLMKAIEQNLNASTAIGYRRLVVLPEPSATNAGSTTSECVSFRSFDAGRVISSPIASHGSLSAESPCQMFLLENNVVTRRGDFQRLSDGTIGLRVAGHEYRIHNSPTGIEETSRLELTTTGEIVVCSIAGDKKTAGQLSVVTIGDPSTLTTSDGVIFTSPNTLQSLSASDFVIRPGSLEISNVNIAEESLLRTTLTGN